MIDPAPQRERAFQDKKPGKRDETKPKPDGSTPASGGGQPRSGGAAPSSGGGGGTAWRSGDPVPITGSASFDTLTVTITITVPVDSSRSSYSLSKGQTGGTTTIASSSGQPAGNSMGSDTAYTTNQDLTVTLTYRQSGTLVTVTYTIPAGSVADGSEVNFIFS